MPATTVDPLLAAFGADVDWLISQGVTVTRHNLAQDPHAFVAHPLVNDRLQRDGDACLPLVLMNGDLAASGAYPRRAELARLVGLTASTSGAKPRIRLSASGGQARIGMLLMAISLDASHGSRGIPKHRSVPNDCISSHEERPSASTR